MSGESPHEPVGSVGEEAAKLFGALSDWATEHAPADPEPSSSASSAGSSTPVECHWCPLCRAVHAVRTANPEVKAQLATAAQSFLAAASALLAAASQPQSAQSPSRPVEHIDLDGDEA